jgi:hypothetical protein
VFFGRRRKKRENAQLLSFQTKVTTQSLVSKRKNGYKTTKKVYHNFLDTFDRILPVNLLAVTTETHQVI